MFGLQFCLTVGLTFTFSESTLNTKLVWSINFWTKLLTLVLVYLLERVQLNEALRYLLFYNIFPWRRICIGNLLYISVESAEWHLWQHPVHFLGREEELQDRHRVHKEVGCQDCDWTLEWHLWAVCVPRRQRDRCGTEWRIQREASWCRHYTGTC